MRILVCGGRGFQDYEVVKRALSRYDISSIVHGGADGADSLAGRYARDNGIDEEVYPALWHLYGKKAGFIRNTEMADTRPDLVIAFPGGKGTNMMIGIARNKHIQVQQVTDLNEGKP